MTISVGYAQKPITPSLDRPVFLAGFDRNRRAESVHDALTARVLALKDEQYSLALISLDLIGLGRRVSQDLEKKLTETIPGIKIILSCTHTHHGPDTIGLWGPTETISGVDPTYMSYLEKQITAAVTQAFSQLTLAEIRASTVHVPGVVKNARDPHILDQELTCLQFVDPDSNKIRLTLLNFPCHPETLWKDNPVITADYPHYLREQVECLTLAGCVFFSGALGGMMTPDVSEHNFVDAEQIGIVLAEAAVDSLRRQPPMMDVHIQYDRIEYTIPLNSPLLERAMQAELVQTSFVPGKQISTEAGLLRLGPVWFAHVPGELLPKLGLKFKSEMRAAGASVCGIIGLANDELGYILPDDDFIYPADPFEPGDHYEETMSVGPTAGSCTEKAVNTLIRTNSF